jgi:hypothetical protein
MTDTREIAEWALEEAENILVRYDADMTLGRNQGIKVRDDIAAALTAAVEKALLAAIGAVENGGGDNEDYHANAIRELLVDVCEHKWVDATNTDASSSEICCKCNAIRARKP